MWFSAMRSRGRISPPLRTCDLDEMRGPPPPTRFIPKPHPRVRRQDCAIQRDAGRRLSLYSAVTHPGLKRAPCMAGFGRRRRPSCSPLHTDLAEMSGHCLWLAGSRRVGARDSRGHSAHARGTGSLWCANARSGDRPEVLVMQTSKDGARCRCPQNPAAIRSELRGVQGLTTNTVSTGVPSPCNTVRR